MIATNLRIVAVVLATIAFYTLLANAIPQVESDVPREFSLTAETTIEDLIIYGEELFQGSCTQCHEPGTRAPGLTVDFEGQGTIGTRCATRVPGMSCRDYIYQSLVEPGAYVVAPYAPIMPAARLSFSEPQILALVAFLEDQGGEVTVTMDEVAAAAESGSSSGGGAAAASTPAPAAGGMATAAVDALEVLRTYCMACHQIGNEGNALGPALTNVGSRLTADEIRREILVPSTTVAEGFEAMAGIMPATFGNQLTAAQLEAIVGYLSEQR